ncbi:hypothetical protein DFH09DRAFT_1070402 [Mycena vulgaris]|nr:hypothetical protein DFH09DRAFT_1070402 [Mycena vulgaris]
MPSLLFSAGDVLTIGPPGAAVLVHHAQRSFLTRSLREEHRHWPKLKKGEERWVPRELRDQFVRIAHPSKDLKQDKEKCPEKCLDTAPAACQPDIPWLFPPVFNAGIRDICSAVISVVLPVSFGATEEFNDQVLNDFLCVEAPAIAVRRARVEFGTKRMSVGLSVPAEPGDQTDQNAPYLSRLRLLEVSDSKAFHDVIPVANCSYYRRFFFSVSSVANLAIHSDQWQFFICIMHTACWVFTGTSHVCYLAPPEGAEIKNTIQFLQATAGLGKSCASNGSYPFPPLYSQQAASRTRSQCRSAFSPLAPQGHRSAKPPFVPSSDCAAEIRSFVVFPQTWWQFRTDDEGGAGDEERPWRAPRTQDVLRMHRAVGASGEDSGGDNVAGLIAAAPTDGGATQRQRNAVLSPRKVADVGNIGQRAAGAAGGAQSKSRLGHVTVPYFYAIMYGPEKRLRPRTVGRSPSSLAATEGRKELNSKFSILVTLVPFKVFLVGSCVRSWRTTRGHKKGPSRDNFAGDGSQIGAARWEVWWPREFGSCGAGTKSGERNKGAYMAHIGARYGNRIHWVLQYSYKRTNRLANID